ncbi:MAG TPA: hydrogenase maturation nickel metallochaperone HypA, partial [Cyanobacteria bacterium UBA11148]|nr:hydrogenase maturation nickel metallochaperone HypA [Cyanobacteria bacterium UBA11148]
RNTFLEGAELVIRETPLIAFCHHCQQDYRPEIGIQYACPDCGSPMEDIRSGRELKIERVEYEPLDTVVSGGQDTHLHK